MGIKKGYLTTSNPDILPSWQAGCSYNNSVKGLAAGTLDKLASIHYTYGEPAEVQSPASHTLSPTTETNRPYGPTIQFTCRTTYANEDDDNDDNDNKDN